MKKITLLDTYCEGSYCYEDYLENCEINEIEPQEENSADYWEWIHSMIDENYDNFISNLSDSRTNNNEVMVYGTLGRWNGRFEIIPMVFNTLCDAIKAASSNGYDDIQVYLENGVVEFRGLHHDGTDIFYIRPISKKRLGVKCASDVINAKNPMWYCTRFPKYIF